MLQLKKWMLVVCIGMFLRSFLGLPQSLDFLRPGPLAAMPTKQTLLQQHHMDVSRHFAGSNRSVAGWCSKSVLVGFLIPEYSRMFEVTKNHQKSMIKRYYRCWKSMPIIKNPWLIELNLPCSTCFADWGRCWPYFWPKSWAGLRPFRSVEHWFLFGRGLRWGTEVKTFSVWHWNWKA